MEGFIDRLLSSIAEFVAEGIDSVVFRVFLRVGTAAILCGLIGLERQAHNKDAGIRTYSMVGIGAALFTLLSIEAFGDLADTSRVAAQVVSGIGFLGAGLIFRQGVTVRGMTTAAGLWAAAAVGMAAGTGQLTAAITVSVIVLAVLWVTGTFVGRIKARSVRRTHNKITLVLAGPGEISSLHKIFDHLAPDVARPIPAAGHWASGEQDGSPTLSMLLTDEEANQLLPMLEGHQGALEIMVEQGAGGEHDNGEEF